VTETSAFAFELAASAAAGAALAGLHLAALWRSVRHATQTQRPRRLLALSALARLACVAAGFALVATRGAIPLLAALLGFALTRTVVLARVRSLAPLRRAGDAP